MSELTHINNTNPVFQNIPIMTERQSSTNTTLNKLASPIIDQNQYNPLVNLAPQFLPPPPAAFQIQPKLNPSAPTFIMNPSAPVQGYNFQIQAAQQKVQESLARLQILSIQLNSYQLLNQTNPTIESLNTYQALYHQYNAEFGQCLQLNQYITQLSNAPKPLFTLPPRVPPQPVTPTKDKKSLKVLETIAEGENEEDMTDIALAQTNECNCTSNGTEGNCIGEQFVRKNRQNFPNFPAETSMNETDTTTNTFGEQCAVSRKKSELERIKKQIRGILNKITAENFDKLSQEIASILKVSDLALIELHKNNNSISNDDLYCLEKAQYKGLIKLILKCILEKAIDEALFGNQYARLCYSLYLYAENNELKKKLFRQQLLSLCHSIFQRTRDSGENGQFIGIIAMIGELFRFGLVSWNVIHSGIFGVLLPPMKPIDIEGVCKLLKTSGNDFDKLYYREVNGIITDLSKYSEKYDFRTQCFVRDILEMRGNDWKQKQRHVKREHRNKKKYSHYNGNRGQQWRNNRYHSRYNGNNNRRKPRNMRPTVEFVKDVTLQDRSHYPSHKVLTKTWAMRNSGEMPWGDNVELVYFKGDKTLSLEDRYAVMNAVPGQTIEISATVKTPASPGRYCTYFRLQKNGKFFGPRVWVDIIVSDNIKFETGNDGRRNYQTNNEANNRVIF